MGLPFSSREADNMFLAAPSKGPNTIRRGELPRDLS